MVNFDNSRRIVVRGQVNDEDSLRDSALAPWRSLEWPMSCAQFDARTRLGACSIGMLARRGAKGVYMHADFAAAPMDRCEHRQRFKSCVISNPDLFKTRDGDGALPGDFLALRFFLRRRQAVR